MKKPILLSAVVLGLGATAALVVAACGSDPQTTPGADGGKDATTNDSEPPVNDSGPPIFDDVFVNPESGTVSPIPETCTESKNRNSYIGCDYWPTVTLNPVYDKFNYAVAVSNPQSKQVTITVTGGALSQALTVTIPASSVQAIPLPWVAALKGPQFDQNTVVGDPGKSRLVPKGAYHLTSDFPVSVYQFSALEFEIDAGPPCPGTGDGGVGKCFSYSNDAALLLPATVATGDYGVVAWPSFGATPGFFAVTATENDTKLTVFPAGKVQGVPNNGPAVMLRGDSYTYTLQQGDVLEMFSDLGDVNNPKYTHDLSGSILKADKPVVTYAGHGCTFIPEGKRACDHLESSMFPIQTLGTQYIVSMPQTPHGEKIWVRIMAFYDNTLVAFDPPVSGRNGAKLNTGDVLDLPGVDKNFAIVANGRINVVEYLQGEFSAWPPPDAGADAGEPNPDLGDPSESPAIPLQQYRSSYSFLAPKTYTQNWIDVISANGNTITLDGTPIPTNTFVPVGGQPFSTAHVLLPANGPEGHEIKGVYPFGLVVYGYGSRTSYMYPGGLDLRVFSIPEPPPPN